MTRLVHAAVETGGTKILCRVTAADGTVLADARWPTTTPEAAADAAVACVVSALGPDDRLAGVGLAAFGPLVVDPKTPDRGRVLATTKPGWSGSNLRAALERRLRVAIAIDTDVNAAALAEQAIGAGRGCPSLAYLTVGTGIGGGLAIGGLTLKGALHPEVGHLTLARAAGDAVPSACPFHPDCAEGLVAGPALARRLGPGARLANDPALLALVADYLAQLCQMLVLAWSPHRIVIGGGVAATPGLIDAIAARLTERLGGYGVGAAALAPGFVRPAALADAGLEGALLMARGIAATALDKPPARL